MPLADDIVSALRANRVDEVQRLLSTAPDGIVNLKGRDISDEEVSILFNVLNNENKNKNITQLDLSNNKITNEGAKTISGALSESNNLIQVINLEGNKILSKSVALTAINAILKLNQKRLSEKLEKLENLREPLPDEPAMSISKFFELAANSESHATRPRTSIIKSLAGKLMPKTKTNTDEKSV